MSRKTWFALIIPFLLLLPLFFLFPGVFGNVVSYDRNDEVMNAAQPEEEKPLPPSIPPLDIAAYDKKLDEIAKKEQRSRSFILRDAVTQYLQRKK